MSTNAKDILIISAVVAVVASVVAYKGAELIFTITGLQQQLTTIENTDTSVIGFAPPTEEGDYE